MKNLNSYKKIAKEFIKEAAWDRKFGEPLPTLEDVMKEDMVKFKDKDGKDHEIDMDTAKQYKKDVDGGDSSDYKKTAVKAAGLDKDDKDSGDEPKGKALGGSDFDRDFDDDEPKAKNKFDQVIGQTDWPHRDVTVKQALAYDGDNSTMKFYKKKAQNLIDEPKAEPKDEPKDEPKGELSSKEKIEKSNAFFKDASDSGWFVPSESETQELTKDMDDKELDSLISAQEEDVKYAEEQYNDEMEQTQGYNPMGGPTWGDSLKTSKDRLDALQGEKERRNPNESIFTKESIKVINRKKYKAIKESKEPTKPTIHPFKKMYKKIGGK